MGFGQGLSGLNAAAQNLDVIGNNIANSGTVGFKAATATFADVYASSRVGLGVQVASINQRFSVGTISSTGNQLDMAIDGAKGMFRVQDASGNVLYTRNGQFFADKDNNIVNAQGQRLTGYQTNGTDLVPIQVPVGNIAPKATDGITVKTNLAANADVVYNAEYRGLMKLSDTAGASVGDFYYKLGPAANEINWFAADGVTPAAAPPAGAFPITYKTQGGGDLILDSATTYAPASTFADSVGASEQGYVSAAAATPFDPTKPDTYTHSLPISVYDSLGNAHQLTQYFVKRPANAAGDSEWDVYYRLNGSELAAPLDDGNPAKIVFTSGGLLQSGGNITLNIANPGGTASPADNLAINLSYADSTQFGGEFTPNFTQTGYATGEYAGMSISSDGEIVANYTNGETQAMGFLALANFNNLQGLQPVGGNA
ncbi:MAG TPA: flagellar hook-basal body complex protein, partial [Eoetvoesiella sp.]